MLRRAASGLGATAAAATAGAAAFYAVDPVTASRTAVLWSEIAPVIVAYRIVEKKQAWRKTLTGVADEKADDAEWDELHETHAKPTVECMRRMLGSYVKLGQFLALRPDVVPDAWGCHLRTLETAVLACMVTKRHGAFKMHSRRSFFVRSLRAGVFLNILSKFRRNSRPA